MAAMLATAYALANVTVHWCGDDAPIDPRTAVRKRIAVDELCRLQDSGGRSYPHLPKAWIVKALVEVGLLRATKNRGVMSTVGHFDQTRDRLIAAMSDLIQPDEGHFYKVDDLCRAHEALVLQPRLQATAPYTAPANR